VTATDPERQLDPPKRERPSGSSGDAHGDPWGVKRAENLLTSLQGILSARVVVSPIGEVQEVHVLTQGGTAAKQVVRNVESALLAQLGLKIDHRKISVAQTADVRPIEALETSAIKDAALKRGLLFAGLDIQTDRNRRVKVAVTLQVGEKEVRGSEEAGDQPRARLHAAGRAAVAALDPFWEQGTLELEGVQQIEAFDWTYVFVGVLVVDNRTSHLLTGTCEIADHPEQAVVLAVLDATNRWLGSRY